MEQAWSAAEALRRDPNQSLAAIVAAYRRVQDRAPGLYSSLLHSTDSQVHDGNLIVVFPPSEQVLAGLVQDKAQLLGELSEQLTGSPCKLQVRFDEAKSAGKDKEEEDPLENPKVKAFLKQFPGKVIVERNP